MLRVRTATIFLVVAGVAVSSAQEAPFEANWKSLKTHEVPAWYEDAKLGIFVHWGLYSVPGWAVPSGTFHDVPQEEWFANNAYAEWYLNTLKIPGSPTQDYHRKTFGEDFDYYDFASDFNEGIKTWRPEEWARLFRDAGAGYVVLTTKHHDGFTLWPSSVANPNLPAGKRHAARDLVGELTAAVKGQGMKMGLYYSGGLDWSFNKRPIDSGKAFFETARETHTQAYADYVDAHWRELIERYKPAILWNDISYPKQSQLVNIVAGYYNNFPEGLINNRFAAPHQDFATPEYTSLKKIAKAKWESTRGLGLSFGYNRVEGEEHVLPADELIDLFVDIVSKNGNLLLNVGPTHEGVIPPLQVERLEALGEWLRINGEAIFGTRPYDHSEGETGTGGRIRFTRKGDTVYAILLDPEPESAVTFKDHVFEGKRNFSILGHAVSLDPKRIGKDLTLRLPTPPPSPYANVIRISP